MSISKEKIEQNLNCNCNLFVFDELDSTNNYIKQNLPSLNDGSVVIAETQSAGRGRMGRSFFSKGGLYISFLFKDLKVESIPFLTSFAAVAVKRAVKKCSDADLEIKWVNDLLLNSKKVCGILAESVIFSSKLSSVVIGIGINVDKTSFPKELKEIATTLYENGYKCNKNELAAELINNFADIKTELSKKSFLSEYKAASKFLGKEITINRNGGERAVALDISENVELIVKTSNGTETLNSGEISIRL